MAMKMKRIASGLLALIMALTCGVAAMAAEEKKEDEPALGVIGQEEDAAYALTVENGTEQDITAVAFKTGGDEEFSDNLLPEDEIFASGESRVLYLPEVESEDGEQPAYDIRIILADEELCVLHGLPIESAEEYVICLSEDGVAYVTYEDEDGEPADTLEAERAIAEEEAAESAEYQYADASVDYSVNNDAGCLDDALFW